MWCILLRPVALLLFSLCSRINQVRGEWYDFSVATQDVKGTWSALACSADGSRIIAALERGSLYISADFGGTWTIVNGTEVGAGKTWQSLASSASGSYIFAAMGDMGYIYSSSDSGATFQAHVELGTQMWSAVACSNDCAHVVATVRGGNITLSADRGFTWNHYQTAFYSPWTSVASSSDGSHLLAGEFGGPLIFSEDTGFSWTTLEAAGAREWCSVAISADGLRLTAGTCDDFLFFSADAGATWDSYEARGHWRSISTSADGSVIIAADFDGYLVGSFDYGDSWASFNSSGSPRNWVSTALSSDGQLLAAAVASPDGSLYLGRDQETAAPSTSSPSFSFAPTTKATYNPTPHRMIATTTPSSSYPTSIPTSSAPSAEPSCTAGSFGEPLHCEFCPPGTFSSLPASNLCSPCEVGSFSSNFSSVSCTLCPWPYDSVSGSSSCEGMFLDVPQKFCMILGAIYLFTFASAMFMIDYNNRCFALVLLTLPVLEYVTAVFYILEAKFYRPYLLWWGIATLLLPSLSFIRYLTLSKEYPRAWYSWMSRLLWLGADRGLPMIGGKVFTCLGFLSFDALIPGRNFYHNIGSLFGCITIVPVWGLLLASQALCCALIGLGLVLSSSFLICWFFIGIYLFQMKAFASGRIWNIWLQIWTSDVLLQARTNLDIGFIQEAFFGEYVFHTMPQLCFQIYNFCKLGHLTQVGIVSLLVTSLMAMYGSYRILYLYCLQRKAFYRVPMVPSWLGKRLYFEEESVKEEYEEHMLGHDARIVMRTVFTEFNPMEPTGPEHRRAAAARRGEKEEADQDPGNPLLDSSEPESLWALVLQSRAHLEKSSEFRSLAKLNSMLKRMRVTCDKDFSHLSANDINLLSTAIPDEFVHDFDRFSPVQEGGDTVELESEKEKTYSAAEDSMLRKEEEELIGASAPEGDTSCLEIQIEN